MKRFFIVIAFAGMILSSGAASAQDVAFDRFKVKYTTITKQGDLNELRARLSGVNRDIVTKGILHDPLTNLDLMTGYDYGQFYDWDLYFENIYQMYNGESKYCFKNLEGFFARQEPSGFIKRSFGTKDFGELHMFKPFIAQTVLLGMRQANDTEWLSKYYENISKYLDFWHSEYDKDGNDLCVWYNSDHSGMDNQRTRVLGDHKGDYTLFDEGVDLNCYLYREHMAMAELSKMIGKNREAKKHLAKAEQIKTAINKYLWDEKDGIYYDRLETTGELNKVKGVSAFAPMYAGIASKDQVKRLVEEHLTNPDEFWAEYPIHTLAKDEKGYDLYGCQPPQTFCNWNGTTWIPFNYMVFHGLMDYEYMELAEELAYKTFDLVFMQNEVTREYYNSDSGIGYGRKPFFGWSTLAYFMPLEFEMKYNPTAIDESEMRELVKLIGTEKVPHKNPYTADWESLKEHKVSPDWFADAKLGVYYHWGVYSVPGWATEWYPRWMYVPDRGTGKFGSGVYEYHCETYGKDFQYHDFIDMWKAPKFSAKEWCDMFEDMGAKFIGTIAEHHDGFSMWDSEVNPWNVADMGPKIDVMKEMAAEVQSRDLKFMTTFHHGFNHMYYPKNKSDYKEKVGDLSNLSEIDLGKYLFTYDSTLVPQDKKYAKLYSNMSYDEANDYWLAKLDEVIDEYCPDYIWMDFGQQFIKEDYLKTFLKHYFNKADEQNKEVVVNTKGEFFPTELAVVNVERATMEDITPDVWITDFILGGGFCFDRRRRIAIDPDIAIKMLADVVSKNGVMLLSAGPMADGTIPEEQVEAMKGIGEWMKLYGEAIYNTRPFHSYGQGPTVLKRDPADEWNAYGAIKKGLDKLCAEDIRYTFDQKHAVYAIQCGWKEGGITQTLKAFAPNKGPYRVQSVEVLGSDEKITWKMTNEGLIVTQPKVKPAKADAAIVYKINF